MQELCIMFVHIQKKEEPTVMPMYHVLEGPTPVETTPDTQESEVGHLLHTHYVLSYWSKIFNLVYIDVLLFVIYQVF